MAPYTLPVDQHEKYQRSVHWRMLSEEGDLSAPTCNDCHGNHGAAPPGVSWVGNVCGQCHTVMASMFSESFHSQIFAMLGNPGCATCHANHEIVETGDELLGLQEGAVCSRCHSDSSTGGRIAVEMRGLIDSLRVEVFRADSILSRAEHAGMEVSQAQFDLNSATTSLVSARTAVHSFSGDAVRVEVEGGLEVTAQAYARGQDAMDELQVRRIGLAVSVSIILLLIVGLVAKIRQVESKPE
jgi:predicted CXXCH cytochrome family protein